jgi:glycosyltransferase involved in cell wall biosynthesis
MKFLFPYMARWHSANWSRYHQLLAALARRGHQVFVLQPPTLDLPETNYTEVDMVGGADLMVSEIRVAPGLWGRRLPLEKLAKKGLYTWACRRPVREMIARQGIDVLLVYNLPQHVLVRNADCLRVFDIADDLPAMLAHEVGHSLGPVARSLAGAWQRKLAAASDLVTVASEILRQRVAPSATLIPNGVCMDEIAVADGSAWRARYPGPIVGYLGAFEYFVDMDLVLEAAGRLPEVTFLLVGGGRDLERVRQKARQAGLVNVHLPGPVSHSSGLDYVAAMDMCVIPFKPGPVADGACPLKLFEYAAFRKPVVSTRRSEVMRVAGDYILFADTADELCQVIREVLQSPDAYRHLQVRGYDRVRANYSWDGIAERFLSAVERAREKKSPSLDH